MDIYCKSDRKQHPSCAGTIENGSAYLHFSKPVASLLVMENADIRTHFLSFFGAGGNNYSPPFILLSCQGRARMRLPTRGGRGGWKGEILRPSRCELEAWKHLPDSGFGGAATDAILRVAIDARGEKESATLH